MSIKKEALERPEYPVVDAEEGAPVDEELSNLSGHADAESELAGSAHAHGGDDVVPEDGEEMAEQYLSDMTETDAKATDERPGEDRKLSKREMP